MNYLESFTNFATGTGFLVIFILFPIIVWKLIQGEYFFCADRRYVGKIID